MTVDTVLASLNPKFAVAAKLLVANCAAAGLVIQPYFGLRTVQAQACIWRRSRSTIQANAAIADLKTKGAPFLASVLEGVGPQPAGPWGTNALPGESWHEFGEAVDCWCIRDGENVTDGVDPLYRQYAEQAEALGLTAGLRWSHPDYDHIQLRAAASPLAAGMSWPEIDAAMKALHG